MRRAAALIVGGGPAGSATAITLARAGVRPELIERTSTPTSKVCGGFLSWNTLASLSGLGIDAHALGARPIDGVRLVVGRRRIETRLPGRAAGLSRARLDEAMLDAARAAGAIVHRGRAARAWEDGAVRLDDGERIRPDALFLATGKHELRGAPREVGVAPAALASGIRTFFAPSADLERALAGCIELHLFDGGYAGLLLQEDGTANLCLSVARCRIADGVDRLIERLAAEAPLLGERMRTVSGAWDAIAAIPYGWRARSTPPGLFRVGDQAAVIASLVGDGIAIALASGEAAASAWLAGGEAAAPSFQATFSGRAAAPLGIADLLRRLAERRAPRTILAPLVALAPGAMRIAARATRLR